MRLLAVRVTLALRLGSLELKDRILLLLRGGSMINFTHHLRFDSLGGIVTALLLLLT